METALLLIALGFGYKIFADASINGKKQLKQFGRIVGIFIMFIAACGAICVTASTILCSTNKECPLWMKKEKPFYHQMDMKKKSCPFENMGSMNQSSMGDMLNQKESK